MNDRLADSTYQVLHDIANNWIWLERRHPSSLGVYRRIDEGVRAPVAESYTKRIRRLEQDGLVETTVKALWAPVRLTLDGKLRWATSQR